MPPAKGRAACPHNFVWRSGNDDVTDKPVSRAGQRSNCTIRPAAPGPFDSDDLSSFGPHEDRVSAKDDYSGSLFTAAAKVDLLPIVSLVIGYPKRDACFGDDVSAHIHGWIEQGVVVIRSRW